MTEEHQTLRIAVVGHTNTGKTSLLRTLTRDSRFGMVSNAPSTTRHVEAALLLINGQPALELYDTPGIEESIALLELLEQVSAGARIDGPERIRQFLHSEEATQRFEQEAKVLRQMLQSDAALYVIDARDPVLAKHRDELEILRYCGIPVMPLLNFIADPDADEGAWRDALARVGLHAIVRFDTVAPERDGERQLYSKLATLLDHHKDTLTRLIETREEEARQRYTAAHQALAELLVDVAAYRSDIDTQDEAGLAAGIREMNDKVRRKETQCIEYLLDIYHFSPDDVENNELPIQNGGWEHDLFDPYTLQLMGMRVGGGAATGAALGAGIDLMTGGLTLGAAAALGAIAGGGLQTLRHYGKRLLQVYTGRESLRINEDILRLLALRQKLLIQALERRGHAAESKLAPAANGNARLWSRGLPIALRQARANPSWSSITGKSAFQTARRTLAIEELARELEAASIGSGAHKPQ